MVTYHVWCPEGGKTLAPGSTGSVYSFQAMPDVVAKLPYVEEEIRERFETEKAIYRRIGSIGSIDSSIDVPPAHPYIVPCLGIEDGERGGCIYLRRAQHGSIRDYFKRKGGRASMAERVRWAAHLAEALAFLHGLGIRQGDVGGRNVLLHEDENGTRDIWVCDFAGSGIDDTPALVLAQGGFRHPQESDPATNSGTIPCELHALGSTIYELVTSHAPHAGCGAWEGGQGDDEWMAAKLLHDQGFYPEVTGLPLGDIISRCWQGDYTSAAEVAEALSARIPDYSDQTEMV
ncbi:Protein kinase-like domain protein [Niveomyces insectorum RCEF 264]|uniref:Protein kinase-like domain protein n=1 Tax=Niveomyces insectorum RCEF 264 TaxID=1081102 RepID=A0A162I7V7_9HYPO|nr:Protein kinase-like domain protein [Niveomyces insectorum RCEF 264]